MRTFKEWYQHVMTNSVFAPGVYGEPEEPGHSTITRLDIALLIIVLIFQPIIELLYPLTEKTDV